METIRTRNSKSSEQNQSCTQTSVLWEQFDEAVSKLHTTLDPKAAGIVELDKFLAEPYLNRTSDPLMWSESRKSVYPQLYQIMVKRLCVTATSVPCERIFSKAGQICSEKRSRLTSKHVAEIIFLYYNLG